MKKLNRFLVGLAAATLLSISSAAVIAQTPDAPTDAATKTRQRFANKPAEPARDSGAPVSDKTAGATNTSDAKKGKTGETDDISGPVVIANNDRTISSATPAASTEVPSTNPTRVEQPSEEADIVNSYNNFFSSYRLGPEDVVSVSVFGQDRYSRSGIVIPPSGRISLALVPGGIFVNGKTVEEVAELIKKRYDEYIIEPQVDVALDKASSYRYSVIGDVAQPGIRLMSRRLTVTEALGEAGGVLQTGDRSKVVVLRKQANGVLSPIAVNVSAIYKGKAPDSTYLEPGDQVIVPGNKLKSFQKIMNFIPILSFARIFTGGMFP
ncbi:MAG TPA: polysaccharide biosynthesis/export family protein [Pyrinomonadaceae bacterium]|nr:polysaccharide biosynthesis/export family protein [Pyrinomonadaceae bacterium]